MSEAMTSESIVEAEWLLKGYWSKMRFAFQTEKGAWSDVDVLAYNPEEKHLVISESKVRGPKDIVFAYTESTEEKYGSILEYDDDNYFLFLRHLPLLCSDGVIFGDFRKMVKKVTVQLVSNYVVTEEAKASAYSSIKQNITKYNLPVNVEFLLDTTLDVIARIIIEERASGQGKRYGHPVLDIASTYLHKFEYLFSGFLFLTLTLCHSKGWAFSLCFMVKASMCCRNCLTEVKLAPRRDLVSRILNHISI